MKPIGLQETIAVLRPELSDSITASTGKQLKFEVGEINLELLDLQVKVDRVAEGSSGIRFGL